MERDLLVEFDRGVDLSNEEVTSVVSDRSSHHKEGKSHDQRVTKVKDCGNESNNFEIRCIVEYCVEEHVKC
jgi:hypothetical protein